MQTPHRESNPRREKVVVNRMDGWIKPTLNPDQGYDVIYKGKLSIVIDISDKIPC